MLRVLGAARKREVKATQNLSIIVLFFMMCWFPLYTINCIKAFCPDCYVPELLTYCCIVLSHLNSAMNPVLYAYHLKDFRAALKSFIFKIVGKEMQQPDINYRFSIASQRRFTSLLDQKRNSMQPKIYVSKYRPVHCNKDTHAITTTTTFSGLFIPLFPSSHSYILTTSGVPHFPKLIILPSMWTSLLPSN